MTDKEPGQYLHEHILSQPRASATLLKDTRATEATAERLRGAGRVFVVGTGTSFHGAMVGQYLLRSAGIESWAVPAFEFSQYPPPLRDDDGIIVLSHRGTKQFSKDALTLMQNRTDRWAVITGQGSQLIGEGMVYTVDQERSPVITVSHVGAMIRLAQITASLAPSAPNWVDRLPDLPAAIQTAVDMGPACQRIAEQLSLDRTLFFIGGGPGYANALEGALKVREAAYLSTAGYDVEGILHGPMVSVDKRDAAAVLTVPGGSLQRIREMMGAFDAIGTRVIAVGSAAGSIGATWTLPTPALPEVLAPIVNVIPIQWLAYHLALRAGEDADSFRTNEPSYATARSRIAL